MARGGEIRFLDLFFVVVFELSERMMKRALLCPFRAETKLTDENVPPPPLDANSQVEEETNPQIEASAERCA